MGIYEGTWKQPDWTSKAHGGDRGKIVYRRNGIHVMMEMALKTADLYSG
jgi:hypothetical protein